MGRKGLATRAKLVAACAALLAHRGLRDLKVADIAKEARTSPATFYLYFNDVTEAVLAAVGELSPATPAILALIDVDWGRGDPLPRAREVAAAYAAYWADHAALFHVRNLAADEGDERFRHAREKAVRPVLAILAAKSADAVKRGWVPAHIDPHAAAGTILAMLERVSAVIRTPAARHIEADAMIDAAAWLIACTVAPVRQAV